MRVPAARTRVQVHRNALRRKREERQRKSARYTSRRKKGTAQTRGMSEWRLSSGAGGMGVRANVQAVALKIAVQAGAADAENLRRAESVAIAHLENFLDMVLADFVER